MRARWALGVLGGLGLVLVSACSSGEPQATGGGGNGGNGGAATTDTTTSSGGASSTSSGSSDPLEAARETCVAHINELRATKGFPPLKRWKEAENCVDQQATEDEMLKQPHHAWSSGKYACNGGGQNECLGHGVGNIVGCVDGLWAEHNLDGCANCDACLDVKTTQCGPGCDFFGTQTGMICGHYVNMAAKYFTKVACGFSSLGKWDALNFQ